MRVDDTWGKDVSEIVPLLVELKAQRDEIDERIQTISAYLAENGRSGQVYNGYKMTVVRGKRLKVKNPRMLESLHPDVWEMVSKRTFDPTQANARLREGMIDRQIAEDFFFQAENKPSVRTSVAGEDL